ncbi:MAG: LysM peptidoglycan-binding domain-containing protein [Candidatus Doudnabacteria bacterium]|nr:LysM peptidoglycan-binding domain-containing protein [Candidatus Doudnabacteria bacterium]
MEHTITRFKSWLSFLKKIYQRTAFFLKYYFRKFSWKFSLRLPSLKKLHFNAFPATHLKNMDWMDFALKFSNEMFVLGLAVIVALTNFYYFTGDVRHNYSDNSHAAKFLSYHTALNEKLYARNTNVITTITKQEGFITQAKAEDFEGLDANYIYEAPTDGESAITDNEALLSQSPDSVANLIAKQIKVYQTKPGDSLKSIAAENNITAQTIIWANKLTSSAIKPGWFLLIPPTDGLIYTATTNDTLPDLAKKYKADLDTIIAYNGLENAEDIDGGQILIIPGGSIPEPPKPTPRRNDGKVKPGGAVRPQFVDNGTGHTFPWGYCTWYVATRVHVPWGGNAKNWLANAKAYGAVITNYAVPGSIVVTTDNRRWGHVAYVESVNDDGFTVSEMNYQKFGRVNTRFIPHGSKIIRGFIQP